MKIKNGTRCDVCGNVHNDKSAKLLKEFMVPGFGKHHGIASKSDPKTPALLHACPTCQPKLDLAMKLKRIDVLPTGPLKKILQSFSSEDRIIRGTGPVH